jgi:hypothetical protein
VTADNPIAALLAAPVGPDWSVEGLAERVLSAVATHSPEEGREFVLDLNTTTDRQSHRLLRPLLACLAVKSAAEAGTSPNLYGGELAFKRADSGGRPVWVLGTFENRPGTVHVALRRAASPREASELRKEQPPSVKDADAPIGPPTTNSSGTGESLTREQLPDRP